MNTTERLRGHLAHWERSYPGALDHGRNEARTQREQWPVWCFVPSERFRPSADRMIDTLSSQGTFQLSPLHLSTIALHDLPVLAALCAWSDRQRVTRPDAGRVRELRHTPLPGGLSGDTFLSLGRHGCYLDLDGSDLSVEGRPVVGSFLHLDHSARHRQNSLRLILDHGNANVFTPLTLSLGGDLDAATRPFRRDEAARTTLHDVIQPLLGLALTLIDAAPPRLRPLAGAR